MRYDLPRDSWKVIPDIWESLAKLIPESTMLVDPVNDPSTATYTFKQFHDTVTSGAASFQKLGVLPGDCVSVFAENSYRWILAEQSVMKAGACNAVRGSSAPVEELQYIYENSKSVGAVVESPALLRTLQAAGGLKNELGPPKFIIVLFPKESTSAELEAEVGGGIKVLTFQDFTAFSNKGSFNSEFVPRRSDQPATIVYTSGTTSKPKGVVLSHSNLLYQVTDNSFTQFSTEKTMKNRATEKDPAIGDLFLTILPCWHILERTAEYYCLSHGAQLCYTNLKNFKKDLAQKKPHFIIAVPRLLETVQKGVEVIDK
jgi:long-chain acyl-CoA synthetase